MKSFCRLVAVASTLLSIALVTGCGSGSASTPATVGLLTTSQLSLAFPAQIVGVTSTLGQSVTITNTGTGTVTFSNINITGANTPSFSDSTTCGSTIGAGQTCTVNVSFTPTTTGALAAQLNIAGSQSNGTLVIQLSGTGTAAAAASVSIAPSLLAFSTNSGVPAVKTLTITNTGTVGVVNGVVSLAGTNAALYSAPSNCLSIGVGAACTVTVTFAPTTSGTSSATLNFSSNTPTVASAALTGTAASTAAASATVDCSVATGLCPALNLLGDPISAGKFHGYADPSMRKDPNSSITYLAYSWAHTYADGTPAVDLHLASSPDAGKTFTEVGALYTSSQSTQTTSTAYAQVNDSSTETIDLMPIPLTGSSAGQTLWVQSHQAYLVKLQAGIYDQLNPTAVISVSAVQLTAAQEASPSAAATALLGLGTAPEARLGVNDTDPTRNVTQNLATGVANAQKCGNFGQSALWYQNGTLYLALECTQITGTGQVDANELAHFLYATTPTGADASKWVWSFVAEFATAADAGKLGATPAEATAYQFYTEPEFVQTKAGQLAILLTPSVFAPASAQQPVIQYGCRLVPVTSLSPTGITLATDSVTGAYSVLTKITETDLYTGANEGPAACTYEPTAVNGVVIGRKYEADPTYGFYIYPVNTGILP